MNKQFIKQVEKILKDSKFSFTVDIKTNVLDCSYNEGKGNFKITLPYSPNEPENEQETEDRFLLAQVVNLFKGHPNREKGNFPANILQVAAKVPKVEQKPYKVAKKAVYIDIQKWELLSGEIDLTNENVKKAYPVETDLIGDLKLLSHSTIGAGVSLLHNGHLIAGQGLPEFESPDKIKNFIDSILKIGIENVTAKAAELIQKKGTQVEAPQAAKQEFDEAYQRTKAIKAILDTNTEVLDSWGAENFVFTKNKEGYPTLLFTVSGFLHIGRVEVVDMDGCFDILTIENGKPKDIKTSIHAEGLISTIDLMVEYPDDHEKYVSLCNQFNGIVEQEFKALKVA